MAKKRKAEGAQEDGSPEVRMRNGVRLVKISFWASEPLDFRLSALAKAQRIQKGEFAEGILDRGCSKYSLDKVLKSAFEQKPSEDAAAA